MQALDWELYPLSHFGLGPDELYPIKSNVIVTDDIDLFAAEMFQTYPALGMIFVVDALKKCDLYSRDEYGRLVMISRKLKSWSDVGKVFRITGMGYYILLCYDGLFRNLYSTYIVKRS